MIDTSPFITMGIVLLAAIVWRVWGWLSKRKRGWNKLAPKVPWDGEHRLGGIKHFEHYGSGPDDYSTGWIWQCTCGIGNSHNYVHLPYSEEEAMKEFTSHMKMHEGLVQRFGS